jgi:hypothetical protein
MSGRFALSVVALLCFVACDQKVGKAADESEKMEAVTKAFRKWDGLAIQKAMKDLHDQFGAKAIPWLMKHACDAHENTTYRAHCLLALEEYQGPDGVSHLGETAEKQLVGLMEGDSDYLRKVAAIVLFHTEGGMTRMLTLMKTAQPATRSAIALSLYRMNRKDPQDGERMKALYKLYEDSDHGVRLAAAVSLAYLRQFDVKGLMPTLVAGLSSESDWQRDEAVDCLKEIVRDATRSDWEAKASGLEERRAVARKALGTDTIKQIVDVAVKLKDDDAAIKVLQLVGTTGDKATPHLKQWVKETQDKVPPGYPRGPISEDQMKLLNVIHGLGFVGIKSGDKGVIPILESLKDHKNAMISDAARQALDTVEGRACCPPYCRGG